MKKFEIDVNTRFEVEAENYDEATTEVVTQLYHTDGCTMYMETQKISETEIIDIHPGWQFTKRYEDEDGIFGHSDYFGMDIYIYKESKKMYSIGYVQDKAIIMDEIDLCTDDPDARECYISSVVLNWFCNIDDEAGELCEYIAYEVEKYERSAYVYFRNIVKKRDEQIAENEIEMERRN